MTLKNILIALTWLFLFLLQVSFMAGTGDLWSAINLLVIAVIGLGYLGSRWSLAAVEAGALLDMQQGLWGVNLISFFLLAHFVYFFKKKIITSDKLGYFIILAAVALLYWAFWQVFLTWIFTGLNSNWHLAGQSAVMALFTPRDVFQFILINFFLSMIFYFIFKRRFSLNFRYEKTS